MMNHRELMMAILHGKAHTADEVNATVIPLDEAPQGYADFDQGRGPHVRDRPARHDRGLTVRRDRLGGQAGRRPARRSSATRGSSMIF